MRNGTECALTSWRAPPPAVSLWGEFLLVWWLPPSPSEQARVLSPDVYNLLRCVWRPSWAGPYRLHALLHSYCTTCSSAVLYIFLLWPTISRQTTFYGTWKISRLHSGTSYSCRNSVEQDVLEEKTSLWIVCLSAAALVVESCLNVISESLD